MVYGFGSFAYQKVVTLVLSLNFAFFFVKWAQHEICAILAQEEIWRKVKGEMRIEGGDGKRKEWLEEKGVMWRERHDGKRKGWWEEKKER